MLGNNVIIPPIYSLWHLRRIVSFFPFPIIGENPARWGETKQATNFLVLTLIVSLSPPIRLLLFAGTEIRGSGKVLLAREFISQITKTAAPQLATFQSPYDRSSMGRKHGSDNPRFYTVISPFPLAYPTRSRLSFFPPPSCTTEPVTVD